MAAQPYELLASIYDAGWSGFTDRYVVFLQERMRARGISRARIVDLACGTGSLALALARNGHDVTGQDLSPRMVEMARSKAEGTPDLSFDVQDMRQFTVEGSIDLVICVFDSLNYLLDPRDVASLFARVAGALSPRGLFVFDVNTPHLYQRHHHGTITRESAGGIVLQELSWDPATLRARTRFRFPDGAIEDHRQRAYDRATIDALLADAGLTVRECCANLAGREATEDSERLIYVTGLNSASA